MMERIFGAPRARSLVLDHDGYLPIFGVIIDGKYKM